MMTTNRLQVPRLSPDGGRAEQLDQLARTARLFRAERLAPLRELEARFLEAKDLILQVHPKEKVEEFGSMDGIETMHLDNLERLETTRTPLVERIEARASEVQAEAQRASAANMTEVESLRRAVEHLAARVAKLEGAAQPGRLPSLPHVARANIPQILGQPGGMGRPAALRPAGDGGAGRVRAADAEVSVSAPAETDPGFTRKDHPLNVIGSPGKR